MHREKVDSYSTYLKRFWALEKGLKLPIFMNNLPNYLKKEVNYRMYGHHFQNNFVFCAVPEDCMKQILVHIQQEIFMTEDKICVEGQPDDHFYILHSGSACRIENSVVADDLPPGSFFSLMCGLYECSVQKHTYVARSTCYVLSLALSDWSYLLQFFPAARAEIYSRMSIIGSCPKPPYRDFAPPPLSESGSDDDEEQENKADDAKKEKSA